MSLNKKYLKSKPICKVTFKVKKEECAAAEKVAIAGDFNDWQPAAMSFNKKLKVFRTKIRLPKNSSFHFRYLVDESEWENDSAADQYLPNEFGTLNSVVDTQV